MCEKLGKNNVTTDGDLKCYIIRLTKNFKATQWSPLKKSTTIVTSKKYAIVNNSNQNQTTEFYDMSGNKSIIELKPMEVRWIIG